MSQHDFRIFAALAMGGIAHALSVHTAARARTDASTMGANACVDQEARGQVVKLPRAVAERDAAIARLARAMNAPGSGPATIDPAASPSTVPATTTDSGPRRYVRFELPNPAVTITQKEDGTADVRTTDPSLAGSIIKVTAITTAGDRDEMLVRIPQ